MQEQCNYLRISVTDRCNLNCAYCSPYDHIQPMHHRELLSFEEIVHLVTLLTGLGIKYVRLTGGEPLVRRDLATLIRMLKDVRGVEEVSLTTNGLVFSDYVKALKDAGLDRINVSLDTLRRDRYEELTGVDGLDLVWRSMMLALEAGFTPVKLNVVLFKGFNDDEIMDFVELTKKYNLHVRFIEYMESSTHTCFYEFVPNSEVLGQIVAHYKICPIDYNIRGYGPAKYIKLEDSRGAVGFISSNTDCFCDNCNRLRLSCDGKLYPCLFLPQNLDTKSLLRNGGGDERFVEEVVTLLSDKPGLTRRSVNIRKLPDLDMCYIGG